MLKFYLLYVVVLQCCSLSMLYLLFFICVYFHVVVLLCFIVFPGAFWTGPGSLAASAQALRRTLRAHMVYMKPRK